MAKRKVDIVVISDVHLGTYGCHPKELILYLKSIKPNMLVLNGDIIDIWQFSKHYWPNAHMQVIKQLTSMMSKGVEICYITGNHDEMLRKFEGFELGNLKIENKLILERDGKKMWFFHGDVFDVTMQNAKWLTKLGAKGYDLLILINRIVNYCLTKIGRKKISLSKKIKEKVKGAVSFINNFELIAAEIAIREGYDYVICGHIHQPEIKEIKTENGNVTYLNSGDWVENLTALEYDNNSWQLYRYQQNIDFAKDDDEKSDYILGSTKLFELLLIDFNISHKEN